MYSEYFIILAILILTFYASGEAPGENMQRINLADDIALDSAQTVGYSNIIKYNMKEGLKKSLIIDPILQEEVVLQQFSDSIDLVNMGKIIQAKSLYIQGMSADDALIFMEKLNSIGTGVLLPEMLNKEVLNVLGNNLDLKDSVYTSNTINRLKQIARMCPYTKGSAVFLSRKILSSIDPMDVFYYNVCEVPVSNTASARVAKLDPEDEIELNKTGNTEILKKNKVLIIKPNPNKGSFFIASNDEGLTIMEVWTIEGKFIQEITYHKGEQIQLKDFEKGIYILKAFNQNGEFSLSKLVIQ